VANAKALGDALLARDFRLVSGGTDNHLLLVDLRPSHPELTGKEAEEALELAGITMNKNTVPGESRSPFVTSGLRIGTPALTTRGMGEGDMHRIGEWIARVLAAPDDEAIIRRTRREVEELCEGFPLFAEPTPVG
jgi:glycine hydroxymethyltransferase